MRYLIHPDTKQLYRTESKIQAQRMTDAGFTEIGESEAHQLEKELDHRARLGCCVLILAFIVIASVALYVALNWVK